MVLGFQHGQPQCQHVPLSQVKPSCQRRRGEAGTNFGRLLHFARGRRACHDAYQPARACHYGRPEGEAREDDGDIGGIVFKGDERLLSGKSLMKRTMQAWINAADTLC